MTAKAIFPIAVLCALLALSACRSPAPTATAQTTAPLANVTLERLRQTEVPQLLDLSGTLEATSRASIAAVTAGRILSDPAQVGLSVRAGQVLFRLDDEEARKHVARAEQALQAAEIDRNINQSVADKYAALARSGDVSQLSADQQIAAAQGHDAAAASDAIDLQLARKALQDDTVLSPIAGVVSEKKHFLGETVAPGEELADIITLHPIRLAMQVPAEVASKLKSGLRVTAASPEGGVLQGFVSLLHPTMDPATRYVTVDALFPNTDGALRPGQFLAARIRLPGVRAVFTLPRSAITVDPATQSAEIYTFEAGHVSRVIVQAGPVFEDRQQITASALQPGQFVVIYTDRTLEDGMAAHAGSR